MKAWIIDDEQHSCEITAHLLKKNCPEIELLGYETKPELAVEKLNDPAVELVFLDIEMPGMNGFDLLEKVENNRLSVIFVTAYDQFAVNAFGVGALDYLLKPIVEEDLIRAVKRVTSRKQNSEMGQLEQLKSLISKTAGTKLRVGTMEGYEFIPHDQIVHCESDNNYAKIYRLNEPVLLVSKTLKEIEEQLPLELFIRVHNSHLVNKSYIKKYIKGAGGSLVMEDGSHVPVSKSRKQDVLASI